MSTNYNKMRYNSEKKPFVNQPIVPVITEEVIEPKLEGLNASLMIRDEFSNQAITEEKEAEKVTVVNCKKLNVRKFADVKSQIIDVVKVDTELLLRTIVGDWTYVRTKSGLSGYVMTKYIKI